MRHARTVEGNSSCSRCGGRMLSERDRHGEYSSCINCGHCAEPPVEMSQEAPRRHASNRMVAVPSEGTDDEELAPKQAAEIDALVADYQRLDHARWAHRARRNKATGIGVDGTASDAVD